MKVPLASMILTFLSVCAVKAFFSEFDSEFSEKNGRLYGGEDINIKAAPHMAQIEKDGEFVCGATIINTKFVLTAAHCFKDSSKGSYTLRVGSGTLKNGGEVFVINKKTKHPKYKHRSYDYDVALIELEKDLVFSESVKCVKIDDKEDDVKLGEVVQITGWGKSRIGGRLGPSLKKVGMVLSSRETCRARNPGRLTSRNICASQREKALCIGDGGNPLIKFEAKKPGAMRREGRNNTIKGKDIKLGRADPAADIAEARLIGVASKIPFYYCNRKGAPFVFTNLKNPEIKAFLEEELKKKITAFC